MEHHSPTSENGIPDLTPEVIQQWERKDGASIRCETGALLSNGGLIASINANRYFSSKKTAAFATQGAAVGNDEPLLIIALYGHSVTPTRATLDSAGWDLHAASHVGICIGEKAAMPTGIVARPPGGFYIRIAPGSGLSLKMIAIGAGVVDREHIVAICAHMCNHGSELFEDEPDMRIAQMISDVIAKPDVAVVDGLQIICRGWVEVLGAQCSALKPLQVQAILARPTQAKKLKPPMLMKKRFNRFIQTTSLYVTIVCCTAHQERIATFAPEESDSDRYTPRNLQTINF